ncbi:MAG: LamG-like jellyroll fold domain-containing protein, partial [Phycisphaerales bacterium JB047]
MRAPQARKTGSIYVLTLFTVAAVGSMILIGVAIRSSDNAQASIAEQMNANSAGILNATEYAIGKIYADNDWNRTAQKGMVFPEFTLAGQEYTSEVLDADTLAAVDQSTDRYEVTVTSTSGIASESVKFVYSRIKVDYFDFLDDYGLQAYWPLNETDNPSTAFELKGGLDGKFLKPSVAAAGMNDEGGYVPVFNNDSDYVEIPWGGIFKQREASMSLWVKSTGTNALKSYGLLGLLYRNRSGYAPTLSLTVLNNSLLTYIRDDGAYDINNFIFTSGGSFTINEWHNVIITWHHSDGFKIFLDGALLNSNKYNTHGISTSSNSGGEQ